MMRRLLCFAAAAVCLYAAPPSRIPGRISGARRFTLRGHVHPLANLQNDQGPADPALRLDHVTLVLKPSDAQQADLERLLEEQQDPASPNYHKWLTPEQYADRFGAAQADIDKMVEWLQSQNLKVARVARGRNAIIVSGDAAQIDTAFQTEIHLYDVNGERHYANASEPALPVALQGVVQAIHGLNNFRMRARSRQLPNYNSSSSGNHYIAPDDFATIFNVQPLYGAGMDGSGQKIAIVGQSQIDTSHLDTFRSYFALPPAQLTTILVPNTRDPGTVTGDAQESDLDLQWASAVARNANLLFVYSYDVMDAVQYVIDQNLAPILSMSYGSCESAGSQSDAAMTQAMGRQANAQGITWVAASGDSGAADCYSSSTGRFGGGRNFNLATDLPASAPEVTGIGGTQLDEGGGSYWNSANDPNTRASARSYIPERAWNDSSPGDLSATGGGASQFFPKPSWQTGSGVPGDGARDVPDISFPASASHDGYMVYTTSGRQAGWSIFGGTSVGAPAFAGVLALLNQYLGANGLGNVNPHIYSLAASTPSAFHDIVFGDNMVSSRTAGPIGFTTAPGYDQVTGLGSIDVYNFVTGWQPGSVSMKSASTLRLSANPGTITASGSVLLTATVVVTDGSTAYGTVTFSAGSTTLGTAPLSNGSAVLTVSGSAAGLASGSNTVTAVYQGDSAHLASSASTTLTVAGGSQTVSPSITGIANAASFQRTFASGMIASIFGTQLAPASQSAAGLPLPATLAGVSVTVNGVPAPLYYASPTQLNVQIPYETTSFGRATVVVNNQGQMTSATIQISSPAPGIFTDSSGAIAGSPSAARGQMVSLYLTGAGAVFPFVATGAAPSGFTPSPALRTSVTVAGYQASAAYIGIPSWSAGVVQIVFTVPQSAPLGAQPVIVSVGGVQSPAATLTVTR